MRSWTSSALSLVVLVSSATVASAQAGGGTGTIVGQVVAVLFRDRICESTLGDGEAVYGHRYR